MLPQALIPILVSIGLSTFAATVVATAIVIVGTVLLNQLLMGSGPKPDASERTVKSAKPPRIYVLGKRRVYGSYVFFGNSNAPLSGGKAIDVFAFCEGPVHAVTSVYLNDDPATITGGFVNALSDGSYGDNKVQAGYNLGANPNTVFSAVDTLLTSWGNNHRGDGIVGGYLIKGATKSEDFLDIYPQGDNVNMSLVVEGLFCHDPRVGTSDPYSPSTWPYTENPVLHLIWFKTVFMELDYDTVIGPVESYWIDAADICDEPITLSAGGTEPRYRGCVIFPGDAQPTAVEVEILATFDGWTSEDENGCIRVFAGKLYTPTIMITSDQIIDYELQQYVEDENRLNQIIGRHISSSHDYNEVEPEAWRDETNIAERGEEVTTTITIQCPSHTQLRRLEKRVMARAASPQRGTTRATYSARGAIKERFVGLQIIEAGFTVFDGPVEITGGEKDYTTGGVVLQWVAVDENVDAWNPATEDGDPAPSAAKTYVSPLDTPTMVSVTPEFTSSGTMARIAIEVDDPGYTPVNWFVRWREDGGASWLEQEVEPTGDILYTGSVPLNADIEVQVSYAYASRFSGWSLTEDADTSVAELAPTPPSEVSATGGVGVVDLIWRNPVTPNLSYVKVWRYTADDFGAASDISGEIVGGLGEVMALTDTIAAGTYYYWVVAYNAADDDSIPVPTGAVTVT